MIMGTARDGEYPTEKPMSGRSQNARNLADRIRRMCEADLECRRLAPAWKLVTIVLNNALSFDCCVVPPEALASYAQKLYEIVDALLAMFVGQDRLEHMLPSKECACPRMLEDLPLLLLRSLMAFSAQYLAIASSVAKSTGLRAMETLALVAAARGAQGKLGHVGPSMDERAMPREVDSPSRELEVSRVGTRPLRMRQTSWKQQLAEAATRCEPLRSSAARLIQMGGDENALWLTKNESPECTPLDDMEFRINARMRLALPVVVWGLCQHQRRQKPDGTAGASLAHLDAHGQHAQNASLAATARSCTMWVVTSSTKLVVKEGSSRTEK